MPPSRPLSALLATLLVALGACGDEKGAGGGGTGASSEEVPATYEEGHTRKGTYRVGWRPAGGAIPVNEPFTLELRVDTDAGPVSGATVNVRCDMPAHGHGMNVVPRVEEVGGGLYRAEGMLLHMRGEWVLGIDVVVDSVAESADFELLLQ